jgi:threonyl-tRNA synthetase
MGNLLEFVHYVYKKIFKMDYHLELSTRPEKAMGSKEMWNKSEAALENALKKNKLKYQLNPGDGAFYGPKIDLHVKDSLGRDWQCATIQLDFNLPQRFKLSYEGKDGKKHAPVMIHRAILGSLERFIGILIEHYSGRLPTWLAPTQVAVLTVANKFEKYAKNITNMLEENGVRVEYDDRNESIGKKVRDAQIKKINYIIVIGEKESKKKVLAIRTANKVDMGVKPQKFLDSLLNEIKLRS